MGRWFRRPVTMAFISSMTSMQKEGEGWGGSWMEMRLE